MNKSHKSSVSIPYNKRVPFVSKIFKKRLEISIKLAKITGNSSILDIGCADGSFLEKIRSHNSSCKCYGIDKSEFDFKNIQNCDIRIGNAKNLPFDKEFFNTIFILDVLEHINEFELVLTEIHRVLKPNGLCILSGPTESWFYKLCRMLWIHKTNIAGHKHTIYDLERGFEKNNFKLVTRVSLPKLPLPPLFRISSFRKIQ